MRPLTLACLAALAAALCSCGGSSPSKTGGITFQEFKAQLQALPKPGEIPCEHCSATGKVPDPATGEKKACPECSGTGVYKGVLPPPLTRFEEVFGKALRTEKKPGDLIWRFWYYPCQEGTIRLPAYLDEKQGDVIRVVTGEPELLKE